MGTSGEVQFDVVVGLPSFNEEASISHVVRAVDAGCAKYFPGKRCLLVNADCKSSDGTQASFWATQTQGEKECLCTERRAEGKGAALRLVFQRMLALGAPLGFCVDTDLLSISPEWVAAFAEALQNGCDMVTPCYRRHRCDGTITNLMAFPLVSAIFGVAVRQPIGGDFAYSRRAVQAFLEEEWPQDVLGYGVDIYMTTTVLRKGYKLVQAELPPKVHSPSLPKLRGMMRQVAAALLRQVKSSLPALLGCLKEPVTSPELLTWKGDGDMEVPELQVNVAVLQEQAKQCFQQQGAEILQSLPLDLQLATKTAVFNVALGADAFAELVFWAISAYCTGDLKEASAVRVLELAYLLRACSHISEVQCISDEEAESRVAVYKALCVEKRCKLLERLSKAAR